MAGERTIDDYVAALDGWRQAAASDLVAIVRESIPDAAGTIKWAQPVFESDGPAVWIKAFPKTVSIGFWRGAELDDPDGLLEGDGDVMRHIKIREAMPIPRDAIAGYARQAVALNAAKGNPTRRAAAR
jgi:hypothetical protein